MPLRRQAGGITEVGIGHAQLRGPLVHSLHKGLLAAGHRLRQRHGAVVGRDNAHRLQHIADRHLLILLQPDLAAAHGAGVGRRGDHVVIVELSGVDGLHGQQQRHDLGDAGGLQLGMFVLGEEDGARLLFHQQSRGRGYFQRLGTAPQRQQGAQQHDEFFHSDPPLLRW